MKENCKITRISPPVFRSIYVKANPCVKTDCIWSLSGSHLPAFEQNTEIHKGKLRSETLSLSFFAIGV